VVSIFNEQGDNRWHTVALSGMTGEVLHDLAGWFLCGARDLDGDGAAELLCTQTGAGLRRPDPAPLAVYTFKRRGEPAALWSHERAAFQMADLAGFPRKRSTPAASRQVSLTPRLLRVLAFPHGRLHTSPQPASTPVAVR